MSLIKKVPNNKIFNGSVDNKEEKEIFKEILKTQKHFDTISKQKKI